jgi:GAF domain-containing protein
VNASAGPPTTAQSDSHDRLAESVALLYSVLLADEDLDDTLRRVAQLATATLPTCDFADVTLIRDGKPVTRGATDPIAEELDAVQYATGLGPCVDAWKRGEVDHVESTRTDTRWPDYAKKAIELGISSTLAIPLTVHGTTIGALNLYSRREQSFSENDDQVGRLFAEQAAIALANARTHAEAAALARQLQEALTSRGVIEQAKGILIARHRLTPAEAFEALVEQSQRENRKLRFVAEDLVRDAQRRDAPSAVDVLFGGRC